jgi:hypothetical protein
MLTDYIFLSAGMQERNEGREKTFQKRTKIKQKMINMGEDWGKY